jgi:serine/threonine protein kinase
LKDYIHKDYAQCLAANRLNTFDLVWAYQQDWFEAPNNRRGGWSGVGRLKLSSDEGTFKIFLKRQENHQRRTLRHPFTGEPTFTCEFRALMYLQKRGVPVPVPVFFGERTDYGQARAILMTQELVGFKSLEDVTNELFSGAKANVSVQRQILRGTALAVKSMHAARILHRSLYPKHLFVRWPSEAVPEVVLIDLEKSRIKWLPTIRTVYDLATLNRRTAHWSRTSRMYFFLQYLGVRRLNRRQKLLCHLILRRSRRK